ncbi:hypothetical protein IPA_09160 [Ignicoccus pacificus DSM 13166]|uniref:Uncharacterized protein n=1 Tax=Ignicoccus pacificus DSM 13166 TaxID=940294 RepID=A0A977PLD5_9CREN|nr:hypothetical protein IPA_09160 [Ignicoccus pacificus DSM 13166]
MSSEELSRALGVVREISICRVKNLAKAMNSLSSAISAMLTALIASFFAYLFIREPIFGSLLLVSILFLLELIVYWTAKKSFTYTFRMAEIAGEKINDIYLMLFPLAMLVPLAISKFIYVPQLTLASPFFAIGVLKIISNTETPRRVGGVALISLSMISSAAPLSTTPTALSIGLALSNVIESLMFIEEAEKCGGERT